MKHSMWKGCDPVIIKAKFLRNGIPSGRPYSYIAPDDGEEYKAGDLVYLSIGSVGQIVEVDVPKDEVGFPVEKLRTFVSRKEKPVDEEKDVKGEQQ